MSDMATLFATDPLKLTRDDLAEMVKEFRSSLHLFKTQGVAPKAAKPAKPSKITSSLSLDDLGI